MTSSSTPGFSVDRFGDGSDVTLVLHGELDLASAGELEATAGQVPAGGSLTLDLTDLGFSDSSGLRVMMNLDRRSRSEGWSLSILEPRGQVMRLLQLSGFDQRLSITSRAR